MARLPVQWVALNRAAKQWRGCSDAESGKPAGVIGVIVGNDCRNRPQVRPYLGRVVQHIPPGLARIEQDGLFSPLHEFDVPWA